MILVDESDYLSSDRVRLDGERLAHIRSVLGASVGDRLVVGRVGGNLGHGVVVELDDEHALLELALDMPPPPAAPVVLALALPRPPTLRKVLQQATAIGVKKIALFHSARVEKSYWQSKGLEPEALEAQLRLGLEQARDTVLPTIEMHRRFRPFAEDALNQLHPGAPVLLADAEAQDPCPVDAVDPCVLVIGPEGGLVDFERELLASQGARLVSLGARPLRVETAVVAALGRLVAPRPARA